jgi:hypothetical protein
MEIIFINREDELRQISSDLAPARHLVDAPTGYGKTELLKRLQEKFHRDGWRSVYVSLSDIRTMQEIVHQIATGLEIQDPGPCDCTEPGKWLAKAFIAEYLSSGTSRIAGTRGVVLLFDLASAWNSMRDTIQDLFEKFVPGWYAELQEQTFFRDVNRHNPLRVVMAGRYLMNNVRDLSKQLSEYQYVRLTPFDDLIVLDAVKKHFPNLGDSEREQLAAHITHHAAGHPACITNVMDLYQKHRGGSNTIDEFFAQHADEIWHQGGIVSAEVLQNAPVELRTILPSLSVFRRYNYPALNNLLTDERVPTVYQQARSVWGTGHKLGRDLLKNDLVEWDGEFLCDSITRRLLFFHMLNNNTRETTRLHSQLALQICRGNLGSSGASSPVEWAIEFMFQWLQAITPEVNDAAKRRKARIMFFNQIVPEAIKAPEHAEDPLSWYEMLHRRLFVGDKNTKPDWEFLFTLKYYLRANQFDESPQQELEKILKGKIEQCEIDGVL